MANKVVPKFNYSGEYSTGADENYWYVYLKTDGAISFTFPKEIDVTVVGGGGGGGGRNGDDGGGGGGGGYVTVKKGIDIAADTDYSVTIGKGGSGGTSYTNNATAGTKSTAFGVTANGGNQGTMSNGGAGGNGSGDGGAINGGAGENGVRAFNESAYGYYGGGGRGGAARGNAGGSGSSGGGGKGGNGYDGDNSGGNGTANTGGGGGGLGGEADGTGGTGGTGIVIIRGSEQDYVDVYVNGTRLQEVYYNGTKLTSWVHNGIKLFFERLKTRKAAMA